MPKVVSKRRKGINLAQVLDMSRRVAKGITTYAKKGYSRSPSGPFQTGPLPMRAERKKFSITPMEEKKKYRGARSSVTKGFLKKGTRKRKYMKGKMVKTMLSGCNRTLEAGKVQTGVDCVWVGHHTFPARALLRQAWMAVLYKYFSKFGFVAPGWNETTVLRGLETLGAGTGWQLVINYKLNAGAAQASEVFVATGKSLLDAVDWATDVARGWNLVLDSQDIEFLEIYVLENTTGATATNRFPDNLRLYNVNILVKSSMKLQNRSKAAASTADGQDNIDQVDNVPVFGKSYSGFGNGMYAKKPYTPTTGLTSDLVGDRDWSVILGSELTNDRKEPPQPVEFRNVAFCGKVHLDPSVIKTSVLSSTYKSNFSVFFRKCQLLSALSTPPGAALVATRLKAYGRYRVFALEKMIDTGASETISIAFESNTEISAKATVSRPKAPGVVKSFVKQVLS